MYSLFTETVSNNHTGYSVRFDKFPEILITQDCSAYILLIMSRLNIQRAEQGYFSHKQNTFIAVATTSEK